MAHAMQCIRKKRPLPARLAPIVQGGILDWPLSVYGTDLTGSHHNRSLRPPSLPSTRSKLTNAAAALFVLPTHDRYHLDKLRHYFLVTVTDVVPCFAGRHFTPLRSVRSVFVIIIGRPTDRQSVHLEKVDLRQQRGISSGRSGLYYSSMSAAASTGEQRPRTPLMLPR